MKLATRSNEVCNNEMSSLVVSIFLFQIFFVSTGTQQGMENSRMYNEMVVLKLVQSMTKMISSPPEVFKNRIHEHFQECGEKFYQRIKSWMEMSEIEKADKDDVAGRMSMINVKMRLISKFNLFLPLTFPFISQEKS